ncbi:MAG: cysteine--tRNA ligase [Candidatus Liptonbacteria bacterium]|nr:cysteine--tRNA ligase [Candidatus Liptonbacteria bacterium]
MKLHDTLTDKNISVEKLLRDKEPVRLFVCGPTVYDHSHIGHARAYLVYDAFVRYLRSRGLSVFYLQNITDIDDKIIDRAWERRIPSGKFAREIERSYLRDMKRLGVTSVDRYARATDHIADIQHQIERLLAGGYAYITRSGVYFSVRKFAGYGKLSRQDVDELRAGWRIDPDPDKQDPLDFAMWKFKKHDYEPSWSSPWKSALNPDGTGRPGWHIEDTAIAEKYFGLSYDLHGGATDLKFPHHEAEVALAETLLSLSPATRKKHFVRIWMHAGLLNIRKEKMSKSAGNMVFIKDFLANHSSESLRLMVLMHHYRSPLDYSDELARQAETAYGSLLAFIGKLSFSARPIAPPADAVTRAAAAAKKKFAAALDDDFNTPKALAALFEFMNACEPRVWAYSAADARAIADALRQSLETIGFSLRPGRISVSARLIAAARAAARRRGLFSVSDALRSFLERSGYAVEDTPLGQWLWRNIF